MSSGGTAARVDLCSIQRDKGTFATTSFQRPHEEAHKSFWSLSRSNFSVVQFSSGVRKVDFFLDFDGFCWLSWSCDCSKRENMSSFFLIILLDFGVFTASRLARRSVFDLLLNIK